MTREEAKKCIAVMQAYADGKAIQMEFNGGWVDKDGPKFNWAECGYRIKPAPIYRPFKDGEELVAEFCKRFGVTQTKFGLPFIWVRGKGSALNTKALIEAIDDEGVSRYGDFLYWDDLFEEYAFLDGSPCGVEEAGNE